MKGSKWAHDNSDYGLHVVRLLCSPENSFSVFLFRSIRLLCDCQRDKRKAPSHPLIHPVVATRDFFLT
jgi:hypothetical protein